jgi:hypothetical protein
MSEFDKLKDKAEDYARQHPEQVRKAEEAAERKLGLDQPGMHGQGGPRDQYGQGQDQDGGGWQDPDRDQYGEDQPPGN